MTTLLIIFVLLCLTYVNAQEMRRCRDQILDQIELVNLQMKYQHGLVDVLRGDIRALDAEMQERFTQLFDEAVVRITEIEARPAEVVTVEVPTVSPDVIARGMQSAGPSQRDDVTILLMDPNECHEEGRAVVPRRKRSPTMRQGGSTYAQSRELNGEWVYRRVGGR